MDSRRSSLLLTAIMATVFVESSVARDHIVGDSIWSIPPSNNFYSDWANYRSFSVGDSLVFRFEMGFYNVVQVSRREFESCSAENPFRDFLAGPASASLNEEGMCYFICSFGNYCRLGQKLAVSVQRPQPPASPPTP